MTQEVLLIIDFGSQYTQLIARRIRELNVYSEIIPFNKQASYDYSNIKGIILSGSPYSVNDKNSPRIDFSKFPEVPLLGICYGAQLIALENNGEVEPSKIREYGRANLDYIETQDYLFKGISEGSQVWMSHGDTIMSINNDFNITASTKQVKIASYIHKSKPIYGIQFHPEVTHSIDGITLIGNFVKGICKFSCNWTPDSFIQNTVKELQETVGNANVILGLSGGVDSSVSAVLLNKAIGKNLYCIFVDNGLLRKDEYNKVLDSYINLGLNVIGVDAKAIFISNLENIEIPEDKRKIIGKTFIEVFEEEAKKINNVKFLAQGTIYPDVIESISVNGPSATIKSHHNVGGLPEKMNLKIVEPLRYLFKDEVRRVGKTLNIDPIIINRHPFPGPGLAIRIIGDITQEKIQLLQDADDIFIEGLKKHNLYDKVWQAGVILLPIKSVGVMGDERTYENVVSLRAVSSKDGMTADWVHLPYEFLAEISNEIINRVKGINRVVYDISSKPPATIEWE
ncbi:MAG: glutamine-hydrolyzing GMP synthase [Bacteroidetes bacterium GWE2_29_8]|nr:MAG: glutamine-hydrolyzing GMP synthase [Bacteroidetes bacterium GWE2_29_8]OFY24385.1 MAG: glutamine-hydrolyzing GMP synthase [Bacteroidetes bacterium GWF2_29_10]